MQIEIVDIDMLEFDPSNARKHSKKNLDAIKGSLTKFGQQKPIVVDKNNVVIAGNGTLEAARALGWDKINVVRTELDGTYAIAYALSDNRTGELAEWNDETLGALLQSLREESFDLSSIGFDTSYLDNLFKDPSEIIGAKELGENEFSDFEHKCPKCGFEFDSTT